MNKSKYHVSTSGILVQCEARMRACPRGGQHFDEVEYREMVNNSDPRVPIGKPKEGSYLAKAHASYLAAAKIHYSPKVQNPQKETMRKLGIDKDSLEQVKDDTQKHYRKLSRYAKRFVVKNGVAESDWLGQISATLLHKYDENNEDKRNVNNAIDKLAKDPKYMQLRETYDAFQKKKDTAEELRSEVEKRFQSEPAYKELRKAEKALHKAKLWDKAGIPEGSKEISYSEFTPSMLTYDENGSINNLWGAADKNMHRVCEVEGKWLRVSKNRYVEFGSQLVIFPGKE